MLPSLPIAWGLNPMLWGALPKSTTTCLILRMRFLLRASSLEQAQMWGLAPSLLNPTLPKSTIPETGALRDACFLVANSRMSKLSAYCKQKTRR